MSTISSNVKETRKRIIDGLKKKLETAGQFDVVSYIDARLKFIEEDLREEINTVYQELLEFKQKMYSVTAELGNILIMKGYILTGFETKKITDEINAKKMVEK